MYKCNGCFLSYLKYTRHKLEFYLIGLKDGLSHFETAVVDKFWFAFSQR